MYVDECSNRIGIFNKVGQPTLSLGIVILESRRAENWLSQIFLRALIYGLLETYVDSEYLRIQGI